MDERYYADGIEVTVGPGEGSASTPQYGQAGSQGSYGQQGYGQAGPQAQQYVYGGGRSGPQSQQYGYGGGQTGAQMQYGQGSGQTPPPYGNGPKMPPEPPKKKSHTGLIIFLIIIAVIVALAVGCNAAVKGISKNFSISFFGPGEEEDYLPDDEYIATMYIEGTIESGGDSGSYFSSSSDGYDHSWTLNKLDELMEDDNNKGLIIFLDTPGGGVYESDELYLKIKEYQEETGRPFYAVMGSECASGGVYVSASADKIYANRNTWTGSIGVTMGTLLDISELLERYGVKTNTITSGRNKAMGSMYDPLTEEQKEILQGLVDEAYEQFVGIVAEGRGMDLDTVYELADGRLYTAYQALELGLIDEIGGLDEAIDDIKKKYDIDCDAVDITPASSPNYFSDIFGFASKIKNVSGSSDLQALENIMRMAEEQRRPMYLRG